MKIVVCGGGISGLASAYYASRLIPSVTKKNYEIILLEKEDNVGGWMKTSENQGLFC